MKNLLKPSRADRQPARTTCACCSAALRGGVCPRCSPRGGGVTVTGTASDIACWCQQPLTR